MRAIILASTMLMLGACGGAADDADPDSAEAIAENIQTGPAFEPSFDCDQANGQAQQLVCNDAGLAALDNELARLFALAEATPDMDAARLDELKAYQRGWIKGRDDCWKADELKSCVSAAYASRIHELRQGYANARSADGSGISTGPLAYACDRLDAGVAASFISSDPAIVVLQWRDTTLALEQAVSASGSRYEGSDFRGQWAFWTKDDEAVLTHPEMGDLNCRQDDIG